MHHTDTSDAYFVLLSLPFVRVHVYFRTCHLSLELESLSFFLWILQARSYWCFLSANGFEKRKWSKFRSHFCHTFLSTKERSESTIIESVDTTRIDPLATILRFFFDDLIKMRNFIDTDISLKFSLLTPSRAVGHFATLDYKNRDEISIEKMHSTRDV